MARPIANWRDSAAYPQGAEVSLLRWAWEFLRRNPDYQCDWDAYTATCQEILPDWSPEMELSDDLETAQRIFCALYQNDAYWVFDPPRQIGESKGEWWQRVGDKGRVKALDNWYGDRYGLDNFPNPFRENHVALTVPTDADEIAAFEHVAKQIDFSSRHDSSFKIRPRVRFVTQHWDGFRDSPPNESRQFVAIGIDLSLPIEPQLRGVKQQLDLEREELMKWGRIEPWPEKRNRHTEWPELLRILDAKADGANWAEIAAELYPHLSDSYPDYLGRKAAEKRLKSAEDMATKGYRFLPMLRK